MMIPKSTSSASLSISLFLAMVLIAAISEVGLGREFGIVRLKKLGGETRDLTKTDDVQSIARFAVQEHNKRDNALLKFGRVLKAKEQVVAGKLYHLTLETIENGKNAVYEATVWVKPWMNFKQLQEFKCVVDTSHFIASDLGILRERFGWHKVPVNDPEVEDAANHAVTTIQQRSNSLFPYRLLEILQAEAEVVKDYVKYNLLLKLRRENKDENLKVNVERTANGGFVLNQIEQLDM